MTEEFQIPIPQCPEIPDLVLPEGWQCPPVDINLPPLIFGTPDISGYKIPAPSGLCSAHRDGEDPYCRICYPVPSVIKIDTQGIPDSITLPFPDQVTFPPLVPMLHIGPLVDWGEISQTRDVILGLIYKHPDYIRQAGDLRIPMWIGCPPSEWVDRVRHEAVSILAYHYWEQSGRVPGRDLDNWHAAEKRFERAFHCWM